MRPDAMSTVIDGQRELAAFPAALREAAAAVLSAVTESQWHPPSSSAFRVEVGGEPLEIPARVYYQQDRVREAGTLHGVHGRIARCLGAIHHDGFLREECALQLMECDEPWVVPFIVNLAGEYVVEIVARIEHALPSMNERVYGDVLARNPSWFATIERRAVSYWNVYYRQAFPQYAAYPGARVVSEFRRMACQSAPLDQPVPRRSDAVPGSKPR